MTVCVHCHQEITTNEWRCPRCERAWQEWRSERDAALRDRAVIESERVRLRAEAKAALRRYEMLSDQLAHLENTR